MVFSQVNRYLDFLCETDGKDVEDAVKIDFGSIRFIVPFYWDLSQGTMRISRLVYFGLIIGGFLCLIAGCSIAALKAPDINVAIRSFSVVFFFAVSLIKAYSYFRSRRSVCAFYRSVNCGFFEYGDFEGNTEEVFAIEMQKFGEKLLKYCPFFFYSVTSFYIFSQPMIDYIEYKEEKPTIVNGINMKLPLPLWTPYDSSDPFWYWFTYAFIVVYGFMCGCIIMGGTIAFALDCQRLLNQIEILIYASLHLHERVIHVCHQEIGPEHLPAIQLCRTGQFTDIYKFCLKKIAIHHQIIIRNIRAFEHIFCLPISIVVILGSMMIALSLFSIMDDNTSGLLKILSVYVVVMEICIFGMMCWYGEQISVKMDEFRFATYCTNWAFADKSSNKILVIIQENTLKSIKLKEAFLGVVLDLKLLARIMNTAYSYVNLIHMFKE